MSLLAVRNKFLEITGRQDLVTPGMAIGADSLINAGQKMLDRMLDGGKSYARYHVDLDTSQILVPLPGCRAVKKVYVGSATERNYLDKVDQYYLRDYYNEPIASLTLGEPSYYALVHARPYPGEVVPSEYNQEWLFDDVIDRGHEQFNSILIMPPPDTDTYTLEVWGLFYSDTLVNDTDTSYWTEQHEMLLVHAAVFQLEQLYRNSEGMKAALEAIKMETDEINKDLVEEETEADQDLIMEG